MSDKSPEESAKALAAKKADLNRQGAEAVVNATIGDRVLEHLAAGDTVTLDGLIRSFEHTLEDERRHENPELRETFARAQAAVRKLRELRAS